MSNFISDHNITIKNKKIYYTDIKTKEQIEKDFNISLSNIHNQLVFMQYEREYEKTKKIKDPVIENYKMPQFAFVYYYFLAKYLRLPAPDELVDEYLSLFCEKIKGTKYTFKEEYLYKENIVFEKNALAARILRAYNSYNREIEFFVNLTEKFEDAEIEYDLVKDLHEGIDLIIKFEEKTYGIATYVGTNNSLEYKSKKNEYRHDYSNIEMIDIVAITHGPNKNVKKYGDTYVYETKVIYDLADKIMK
jgi:hypothetical protein